MTLLRAGISILSGFATGIGFIIPFLSHLIFVSAIPFLWLTLYKTESKRSAGFYGALYGLGLFGCAFFPLFWPALPLSWIGAALPLWLQVFLIGFAWSIWVSCGIIATALFAVAARMIATSTWRALLIIPSLWVLTEVFLWFLISLAMYSPEAQIGIHMAVGSLGYLVADNPALLQAASWGGIFILSFIAILFNVLALSTIRLWQRNTHYSLALIVLALVLVGTYTIPAELFSTKITFKTIDVAIVSTITPLTQTNDSERAEKIGGLLSHAHDAELIVLPEGTAWESHLKDTTSTDVLEQSGAVLIDSYSKEYGGNSFRIMRYLSSDKKTDFETYKQIFTPVGEYVPYIFYYSAVLFGNEQAASHIKATRSFQPGSPKPYPVRVQDVLVSALFCNEVLSPFLYSGQANAGTEVLVNSASHVWYHSSNAFYELMTRAARVRAVETGRVFIQASDTSPSFILNNRGATLFSGTWGTEEVIRAEVPSLSHKTPYTILGGWILLIPIIVSLFGIVTRKKSLGTLS